MPKPSPVRHSDRWSPQEAGDGVSMLRPRADTVPVSFDANPKPITVDLARSALLIIDMKNDFLA